MRRFRKGRWPGTPKLGVLVRLKNSARNCSDLCSVNRNSLNTEKIHLPHAVRPDIRQGARAVAEREWSGLAEYAGVEPLIDLGCCLSDPRWGGASEMRFRALHGRVRIRWYSAP